MLEGGHGICAIFQAASAAAARATNRSATATATISLDIGTYTKKEIEEELKKTSVLTSVALAERFPCSVPKRALRRRLAIGYAIYNKNLPIDLD